MSLQTDFTAKQEEIAAKRLALSGLFDQANKETDPVKRDGIADGIKSANDELAALVDAIEPLGALVAAEQANKDAMKALRQPVGRQVVPADGDRGEPVDRRSSPAEDVLSAGIKSVGEMLSRA